MTSGEAVIRRVTEADAAMARALRLEMLADAPLAFIDTLDQAAARPHAEFAVSLVERTIGNGMAQFVAETGGRLVATAAGVAPSGTTGVTLIFSVYVTPSWRGTGLLGRLVDTVAHWSVAAGRARLELEVVTGNERAIRAYQRLGFVDTGRRARHPAIPILTELTMSRPARPEPD